MPFRRNLTDFSRMVSERTELLQAGTAISLPWVNKITPDHLQRGVVELLRLKLEPICNIVARRIESDTLLEGLVSRLVEAGVTRVLVVAGDPNPAVGRYDKCVEVLPILAGCGIKKVWFAGHPTGHLRFSGAEIIDHLEEKICVAEECGVQVERLVTQLVYSGSEARAVETYLQRLSCRGIEIPVWIGVPGPATFAGLLDFARRCALTSRLHYLLSHPTMALLPLAGWHPERFLTKIGAMPSCPSGLHLMDAGRDLEALLKWRAKALAALR
ncbi:MAG: hypothetical protein Q7S80_02055 [bacterium]|nr:hypothetical protein [bacterium]